MNQVTVSEKEAKNLTNKQLVERYGYACSRGNEYDNRSEIKPLKEELLKRLKDAL